ncbi:hypothetical protein TWF481_002087 [Arthrobotrys musiformis]|uniref:Uncharacterized protein n=1 Tax=Arthrobotrys musiformis TaxID=47236 RepID=A0AAV9VTB4_9PEZI
MEQSCTLKNSIQDGTFFTLPVPELLSLLEASYPSELELLKTAYSVPPPPYERPTTPSPSRQLYAAEYGEINRTIVSVLSLRWVYNRDYASFTATQIPHIKLTRQSFDWMSNFLHKTINTPDDIYTLITSIIINDLGKSQSFIEAHKDATNTDVSRLNHDMILHQIITKTPYLIPSLSLLSQSGKGDLIKGIELSAEFSFGQLAQAENTPGSLHSLLSMKSHARAFDIRFMEQILDIAGAAGHIDHTCAKKLTDPVFQSFKTVYEISVNIIDGKCGVREGYDINLIRRVGLLEAAGWTRGRELDVKDPVHRALMRLLCITNSADVDAADLVHDTFFNILDEDIRRVLVSGMEMDGTLEQPAVQATYIPAMSSAAINATKSGSKPEKEKALAAVLTYLSRTLEIDIEQVRGSLPLGVVVIERDIRKTIMHVINSERFREDPSVLDSVSLPDYEAAAMAEGYEWVF